jgi:hypothetical protein
MHGWDIAAILLRPVVHRDKAARGRREDISVVPGPLSADVAAQVDHAAALARHVDERELRLPDAGSLLLVQLEQARKVARWLKAKSLFAGPGG